MTADPSTENSGSTEAAIPATPPIQKPQATSICPTCNSVQQSVPFQPLLMGEFTFMPLVGSNNPAFHLFLWRRNLRRRWDALVPRAKPTARRFARCFLTLTISTLRGILLVVKLGRSRCRYGARQLVGEH
jgi:hypothetical protein